MRGRTLLPSVNRPASQVRNPTHGYHRYMPLREFQGKDAAGRYLSTPVWHDFVANKTYDAGQNWDKPPPPLASGDPGRELRCQPSSASYREHYARIFGHD